MKKNVYIYAFEKSFPVMIGYVFLGTAYGLLMNTSGYGLGLAIVMSVFVYAGSLQYASITMLLSAVNPLYAFLMAIMINARHIFYGISMLNKFSDIKKFKSYLIFGLTDETFSVLCDLEVPESMDKNKLYILITLYDHLYWIIGTIIGCIIGSLITFNSLGLDFVLTALFVVIYTNQWLEQTDHNPALIGIVVSIINLIIFGSETFLIPAMISILVVLIISYTLEQKRNGVNVYE